MSCGPDRIERLTIDGHDRDVAASIRSQANLGKLASHSVSASQVEHLLAIGYRRGYLDGLADGPRPRQPQSRAYRLLDWLSRAGMPKPGSQR